MFDKGELYSIANLRLKLDKSNISYSMIIEKNSNCVYFVDDEDITIIVLEDINRRSQMRVVAGALVN